MEKPILQVKNLSVERDSHIILEDITFSVNQGETLAIIGPNGAGKTTLFRALLNLVDYEGKVEWREGIKIGYVPQKLYIDPELPLTTYEFFSFKEKNKKKLVDILKVVGINEGDEHILDINKHILQNKLGNLSGGELQRVLIAWALLGDPDILLFDEPTAGVDFVGEETIYSMLDKLKGQRKLTILLISHELDILRKHATNVLCINKEKVCYGLPTKVMNKEVFDKLFGEEVDYYEHHHRY